MNLNREIIEGRVYRDILPLLNSIEIEEDELFDDLVDDELLTVAKEYILKRGVPLIEEVKREVPKKIYRKELTELQKDAIELLSDNIKTSEVAKILNVDARVISGWKSGFVFREALKNRIEEKQCEGRL